MVTTKFYKLTDDGRDQEEVAVLTVADDDTWTIAGDEQYVPLDITILTEDGRLSFENNPTVWAQRIPQELRGPYLVAVSS
ncbi:hypothetical protein [Arthrobacter woluwensis]|uniref:hypothetical protein n=1 Tax=Arthrobacter woluwensis TaxID=156980 RepID=UPI0037FD244F